MKLSAPPPPPPPPPEDGAPAPNDPVPTNTAPASEVPPPEVPAAPSAPKPLVWPAWYAGVDAVIAGLVLVFAFAAASFVARNSDVWLHLAAGKRLFAGQYTPGSDPFSYSGADRAWVNHSWLADAGSFLLYGGTGKVLVIVKALLVALAFGLVIAIRRPKFPLWPWAAVACVAVLASATFFTLRPQILSILFLALTLFLVFRLEHKPNSWRFPGAIGVTFWLWANCDQWFFLGPLALVLLLVGDLIQTKLLKGAKEPTAETEDEPLGRLPDTATLAKALGIGVLACMLNPHHVRVWELPFELVGAPGAGADPRLRSLLYAPINADFLKEEALGYNRNGLAYAVLLLGGAALIGFAPGRVRVAHVALWIGFAALSLLSMYAIPFFALVAVPLIAAQLNSWTARLELKTLTDKTGRGLLVGSSLGRLASVLAVCTLCIVAYPGWVHPEPSNPASARRIQWAVEPEPSLTRAAEQFQKWRESGALPADARGMITNTDLANYVAWFAPQEKVFINARFNHHRPELPDYLAVRKGLGLIVEGEERPNPKDATDVLNKRGADYIALHAGPADSSYTRSRTTEVTSVLYRYWSEWSPWFVDGRTTVFGWRAAGKPTFAALRVDPVVLAFGPEVVRVPVPELTQPPPQLGWEGAFLRAPRAVPAGAAEAAGWIRFKKEGPARRQESYARRQVFRDFLGQLAFAVPAATPAATNLTMHTIAMGGAVQNNALRFAPDPADASAPADADAMRATPFLALRAARRAIAENPDHPDPYLALAQVLSDPDLPLSESERALGIVIAYRQCLDRLPKPDQYKRGQFVASPFEVARQLAIMYLNPDVRPDAKGQVKFMGFIGMPIDVPPLNVPPLSELFGRPVVADPQHRLLAPGARVPAGSRRLTDGPFFVPLDAGRDLLKLALAYAPADLAGDPADLVQERIQGVEMVLKEANGAVVQATERYDQTKDQKLGHMIEAACRNGLIIQALALMTDKESELAKEYKEALPVAMLLRVGLEMLVGRVENASEMLEALSSPEWTAQFDGIGRTPHLKQLKYAKALAAGEYKAAGELWEATAGAGIGSLDKFPPAGPTVPRAFVIEGLGSLHRKQTLPEVEKVLGALLAPPLVPMTPLTQPLTAYLWRGEWLVLTQFIRQQIAGQLQAEANFFYRRGVLSLFEGDIPAAKERFRQSNRKAPKGWELQDIALSEALQYLRMIERAEKKAAP